MAGGFIVPNREGRLFMPSPPGFNSGVFAFIQEFAVFEIMADKSFRFVKFASRNAGRREVAGWSRGKTNLCATARAVSFRSLATPS